VILRKEDCEVARTAEQLISWIDSVHERFGANETYKEFARLGKGLTKQFYEEILPLGLLARHKYLGQPFLLRSIIGNQNYDAEIIPEGGGILRRLEFVNTYHDYDLALRMEYLTLHGHVPLTGPIRRLGTRAARGQVHVESNMVDHEERLGNQLSAIQRAVGDKLSKKYNQSTLLAVVIDDWGPVNPEKDSSRLKEFVQETIVKPVLDKFKGLFILGASGETFLEYE
jgi:hypothetical protein